MPSLSVASQADAADLAPLARETFAESFTHYPPDHLAAFQARYTADFFAALARDPGHRLWVLRAHGRAIGYAHAGPCELPHPEVTPACGELKRLYVRREFQGQGLGSLLLAEALTWLAAPGRTLWVGVFSENPVAQKLYARHGFSKVGEYAFVVGGTRDREFILRRR